MLFVSWKTMSSGMSLTLPRVEQLLGTQHLHMAFPPGLCEPLFSTGDIQVLRLMSSGSQADSSLKLTVRLGL